MGYSTGRQRAQHARFWVALDGVENIAREVPDEVECRSRNRRRTQAEYWVARPLAGDDGINGGQGRAPRILDPRRFFSRSKKRMRCLQLTHLCMTLCHRSPNGEYFDQIVGNWDVCSLPIV